MPWHAHLTLAYLRAGNRTLLQHAHSGPLRTLKSLYPEGDGICHSVIVHPPGGLVGGDELRVQVRVGPGAHALISTPGATRFYASDDLLAQQHLTLDLEPGARLEWLPLETIAYPGCLAANTLRATLAEGAEMIGWDVTALGLPGAGQPFDSGRFSQRLEIPGLWLEQARMDARDRRLLDAPLGLAGQRCLGMLWLASGSDFTRERRERLLDGVRAALDPLPPGLHAAATCPNPRLLLVRALAPLVEPLMAGLQQAWAALRPLAWQLGNTPPRIWRV